MRIWVTFAVEVPDTDESENEFQAWRRETVFPVAIDRWLTDVGEYADE